jgi:hypothetical protein
MDGIDPENVKGLGGEEVLVNGLAGKTGLTGCVGLAGWTGLDGPGVVLLLQMVDDPGEPPVIVPL